MSKASDELTLLTPIHVRSSTRSKTRRANPHMATKDTQVWCTQVFGSSGVLQHYQQHFTYFPNLLPEIPEPSETSHGDHRWYLGAQFSFTAPLLPQYHLGKQRNVPQQIQLPQDQSQGCRGKSIP